MGMAASQARFLGITARKTNTEYEGQQVNQQRTALANQSANLFNQMLALEVPSPPSKSDSKFTKTVYSFIDDTGETATIQTIVNNPDKSTSATYPKIVKYTTAELQEKSYRSALSSSTKTSTISYHKPESDPVYYTITVGSSEAVISKLVYDKDYDANDETAYTKIKDAVKAATTGTEDEKNAAATAATNNLYKFVSGTDTYYLNAPAAGAPGDIYDKNGAKVTTFDGKTITGNATAGFKIDGMDLSKVDIDGDQGSSGLTPTDKAYLDKIMDTYTSLQGTEVFYKYSINGVDYYIPDGDTIGEYGEESFNLKKPIGDDKSTYPYSYMVEDVNVPVEKQAPAAVTYDSSGRLQSIILKDGDDSLNFTVSVNSVTDEEKYEDAMNEYKYKMAQYEKEVEDINAKTKAIQEQDRTLELRLKQLDTEQEALTQEMDAIKKVIDKNVETTFKTFA